jgi:hypothetical protein
MSQKRTFVLELKNNQAITLEFSPIDATDNRLWQMFATTEALDTVQQLISVGTKVETKSARKTAPEKSVVAKKKK